jgi:restriction endonuclease Mrr
LTLYIGIDPGVNEVGLACCDEDAQLLIANVVRCTPTPKHAASETKARAIADNLAVLLSYYGLPGRDRSIVLTVERMQIYAGARQDPNDMIAVEFVGGMLAGMLHGLTNGLLVYGPQARQWKGTITKAVHHRRLQTHFPQWVPIVEKVKPKGMQGHVWDAVGLLEWGRERNKK